MQISFECVSFGVFCKHANLDLERILRDSCLYLFFVIIGKLVNQAFKFQSFVLSNVYQNQLRSKGISEYSLEIFHNLIKNTRKSLRSLRGQKMKSILFKTQVINNLFLFYSLDKTKTQNNIVIFGIFHKELYYYFGFSF